MAQVYKIMDWTDIHNMQGLGLQEEPINRTTKLFTKSECLYLIGHLIIMIKNRIKFKMLK